MQIRDRVKEFRRIRADQLRPNPRNWRHHPPLQRDALRGLLAEVGFAGAVLVRELTDGSYELIDGHLRAETVPDLEVPALVLDVDATEAAKLLALVDPLSSLAEPQSAALSELLATIESENTAIHQVISQLAHSEQSLNVDTAPDNTKPTTPIEAYQVLVECRDETEQRDVFERLTSEGFRCRALTL